MKRELKAMYLLYHGEGKFFLLSNSLIPKHKLSRKESKIIFL